MFHPFMKKGNTKYGGKRGCSEELFRGMNLSEGSKRILIEAGNYGLAKSTWSSYNTAERLLAMCRKQRGRKMELPLSEEDCLEFAGWLLEVRKVKTSTVSSYLSGLRQLHIMKGMEPPMVRSGLFKFLMKGRKNMENIKSRREEEGGRLLMTMNMMRLLKTKIIDWEVSTMQKLLMWSVATLAFHGALRIHEILNRCESEFDPDFSFLTEDLQLLEKKIDNRRVLQLRLKCPKESKKGKAVIVEVYETQGTLCPVKAFERWKARTTTEQGFPLFRDETGTPLTGRKLNSWIKETLKGVINYDMGKFTSHSFRIGLATTMGSLGFTEDDIKEAGRWSSKAYELYLRLPRVKRAAVAARIGELETM